MHYDGGKLQTRILEQNILNLSYGQFDGIGDYDFPELLPVDISRDTISYTPIQGFNFALKEKNPQHKAVHFFLHDYQFERVWKYPDRYVDVLRKFSFVLSPDFSVYLDMPKVLQLYNIYRNHWCARYWQEHGIKVIPTVTWSNQENLKFVLQGLPKNSIIAVSTMGEGRWSNYKELLNGWDILLQELEPKHILLYGKDLSAKLKGDIIYKKYISSKAE